MWDHATYPSTFLKYLHYFQIGLPQMIIYSEDGTSSVYYILCFQLKSLRENMDSEGHPLMDNYRPTQVNANTLYFYGKAWVEYGHGLSPTYWFLQTTALELPFTSFTSTTGMNIYIITKRFKITQQINFYIRPLSSDLTCVWLKKMEWSG